MKSNSAKREDYFQIPEFDAVYLEDSYLIALEENETDVSFLLELVITEAHPRYTPPPPDEHYCYKRVRITFPNVRKKVWVTKTFQPIPDLGGEPDFGNIDVLYRTGSEYRVAGEWGEVHFTSDAPELDFLD